MSKLFDLTGRLALVTGSSRGIGRAIAEGYVAAGARVVVNGRDAKAVARPSKAIGANAVAGAVRRVQPAAVEAAVAKIEKEVGPIDILVNNAGMQQARRRFVDFPEDDWRADHGDQPRLGVLPHASRSRGACCRAGAARSSTSAR